MRGLAKDKVVTFRTNSELIKKAKKIAKANNFDMSYLFNIFLEKMVNAQEVPTELFEDDDYFRNKAIDELFFEVNKGYQNFLNGDKGKSVEEVFSKYEL